MFPAPDPKANRTQSCQGSQRVPGEGKAHLSMPKAQALCGNSLRVDRALSSSLQHQEQEEPQAHSHPPRSLESLLIMRHSLRDLHCWCPMSWKAHMSRVPASRRVKFWCPSSYQQNLPVCLHTHTVKCYQKVGSIWTSAYKIHSLVSGSWSRSGPWVLRAGLTASHCPSGCHCPSL